jgi:5-carboxymethyl-2-hydroxymuconate isomerase
MPHLTLEYTANVPPPDDLAYMLLSMHKVLSDTGGIKIENCKSRMRYTDTFIIGEGDPLGAFLHLDVSFLEGRADDIKTAIGNELMEILKQHFFKAIESLKLQITVEIRDISPNYYFKHPEGTLNYSEEKH